MIIKKQQFQALQAIEEERHGVPELCGYLRQEHTSAVERLSPHELEEAVRVSLREARALGLFSEADIYRFITVDMSVCPAFYRDLEVRAILLDRKGPPAQRMLTLALKLPTATWARLYTDQRVRSQR